MAGAQVQIQAVVQPIAQAGPVDGAVLAHVKLGVGGEQALAVVEPVGHLGMEPGRQGHCARSPIRQVVVAVPGVQPQPGGGGVGLAEGGLQGQREAFPLWAGQQGEAAANAPFAAVTPKQEHPGGGGAAQPTLIR